MHLRPHTENLNTKASEMLYATKQRESLASLPFLERCTPMMPDPFEDFVTRVYIPTDWDSNDERRIQFLLNVRLRLGLKGKRPGMKAE
jgi:hypothetical protein